MIRLAQFTSEQILPFIGLGKPKFNLDSDIGTVKVKASSNRLECLKRNQSCVRCHRKGKVWILEASVQKQPTVGMNCFIKDCPFCELKRPFNFKREPGKMDTPHLNLYAKGRNGSLILMTQDHIHPKHAGGSNGIENLQTMCRECNSYKGGMLPHEYAEVAKPHERDTYIGRMDGGGAPTWRLPEVHAPAPDQADSSDCAAE
jgi:5-methylcytosine-specific restriction endonuclease McrA